MRLPFFRAALVLLVLTCASARASGLSVEGQVLGPDGKGLAGARVELRPVLRVYDGGVRELEGKGEPGPAARIVTEADGWFRFAVPAKGPWRVTVTAEGFPQMISGRMVIGEETIGPARLGSEPAEGSPWRPVRPPAHTRAAGSLPWRLEVYEGSKPVPGAIVRDVEGLAVLGRTGADGSLLLDDAPVQKTLELRVETRDGRIGPYDVKPIPEASKPEARVRRRLLLPPVVTLEGRVVDQTTGQPVPGAWVWPSDDPAAVQVTDLRGMYRLPWTANTWARLCAVAAGHFGASEPFFVEEGRGTPPELALTPAGFLAGTVVDEDGSPVARAEVLVYPAGSDDEAARARTGSDGSFRLSGLPAGWFDLEARRRGYLSFRIPGMELRPDSPADLGALVLTRGRRLEGRAIGPLGEPVEGAEVWVVPDGTARGRVWAAFEEAGAAAVTDQDGRFVLQGLNPRKTLDLDVCRPGYITGWISVERSEEGPVQVELARSATVSGRVIDPDGKPVAGASVYALLSGASRGDFSPPASPCPHYPQFSSAKTDTQGRFTLQPLDEGLFEVAAQAEGYLKTAPQEIEAAAGWESAGLTLVLLRETRGTVLPAAAPAAEKAPASPAAQEQAVDPDDERKIVLSGRIVGIEPEDLPDVELNAYSPERRSREGFVDRDGIYRFLSMAPGEWEVTGYFEGRNASAKIEIVAGEENPVLDLVFPQEP
jgi:protocatechuate 3,4-dioxygenase beta subunit